MLFTSKTFNLSKKATKVAYNVKNTLQSETYENIPAFLKSFDAVVKPIMIYGSEIWGIEDILKLKTDDTKLLNYNKEFEMVQITFCKQILRVHNKSFNILHC